MKLDTTSAPEQPSRKTGSFESGLQLTVDHDLCAGCGERFTPSRPNQRHCHPRCRKLAQRKTEEGRRGQLFDRLVPVDPARPE